MIIYGTRTTTPIVASGNFHCPRCGPNRKYDHRKVNSWFTLYFIPIIPLGSRGSYVECQQCAGTFGPEVLAAQPTLPSRLTWSEEQALSSQQSLPPFETGMHEQIKRMFVLAAITHGKPSEKTLQAVQHCYRHIANSELRELDLESETELARHARTDLLTFTKKVAHVIEPSLCPKVLTGVHLILRAQRGSGAPTATELRQLGQVLHMSPQQLESTLATVSKA